VAQLMAQAKKGRPAAARKPARPRAKAAPAGE
jgi:hypothetical protein